MVKFNSRTLLIDRADVDVFTAAERDEFRLPDELTVSEWADKHRVLDERSSAEAGPWNTDRTPYLREPMDAFADDSVEEIVLMFSTQVGKTECINNMIGYAVDQDPGPAMMVMDTADACRYASKNRIEPMIRSSPALARHIPECKQDMTVLEYGLDRMTLYFGWSNSPGSLSSRPVRYVFMDEVDKFPKFSGEEGSPIDLADERTRTFITNRKKVRASTPTTRLGYIFGLYNRTDKRRFWVPCPHCGAYQVLKFGGPGAVGGVKWSEKDGARAIRDGRLAWYECEKCRQKINDVQKVAMNRRGKWCPEGCAVDKSGQMGVEFPALGPPVVSARRGYHLSALYSPWLTWGDIAAEFLESKDVIAKLMNFINSWLGWIWEEKIEQVTAAKLAQNMRDYQRATVPDEAILLTAGVDVQKLSFHLVVRAWGYGEVSWLVLSDQVDSWELVDLILMQTVYKRPGGRGEPLKVKLALIDSGYRTDEVYGFCRARRDVCRPIKGQAKSNSGKPFWAGGLDKHPRTGETLRGGLTLWHVDTSHYKDKLARMINETGRFNLHAGVQADYFNEMESEHKVLVRNKRTGHAVEEWQPVAEGKANHKWDCEVYNAAAADMLRVSLLSQDAQSARPAPSEDREERGAWMRPGGAWHRPGAGRW